MKLNREQFLARLQAVQPALTKKDDSEGSSCFIFQQGKVYTFNVEMCCQCESGLDEDFYGAIPADPLLKLLEKLPDPEIDIETTESEFLVLGKRRKGGIRLELEIDLERTLDTVDTPKKWRNLPEGNTDKEASFSEAVSIVGACAGKNDARFALMCVHFHTDYLEACDNYQLTRYEINLGIKKPFLLLRDSLKHVTNLGMTEFGETDAWVHFRNPSGVVLSSRRYLQEFPDLSQILDVEGVPLELPKGLGEAVQRAAVFSAESNIDDKVLVELRPGKLKVSGRGDLGWFEETKKLSYDGTGLAFMVAPNLLVELTKRHNHCYIAPERIKVDGGKYQYVSCLSKVKEAVSSESNGEEKPRRKAKAVAARGE